MQALKPSDSLPEIDQPDMAEPKTNGWLPQPELVLSKDKPELPTHILSVFFGHPARMHWPQGKVTQSLILVGPW